MLSSSGLGGHIGTTKLQSPTCADDIALAAQDRVETQSMIDVVHKYSQREHYEIQARKSAVLIINSPHPHHPDNFYMGDSLIPVVQSGEHLGITRDSTGGPGIQLQVNMKKARSAAYSLMGAGMHGKNGLPQSTCIHLYRIHVLPVLTYGLGIFNLEEKDLKPIEHFQRTMLKQIMSLADNVADPAVHVLSGVPPVEFEVHRQALGYLGSIARKSLSAEYAMAKRQLILKTTDSKSWFNFIKSVCIKYDLPLPNEVLHNQPTKQRWKSQVKEAMTRYWESRLIREASLYPSLRYINLQQFTLGKPHTIIRYNTTYRGDIIKCKIKLLLATGTYLLQAQRSRFNQFEVDSTCLLCKKEPENREHFLSSCEALAGHRSIYADQIQEILVDNFGPQFTRNIMNSSEEFTQLIMDCTSEHFTSAFPFTRDVSRKIELITQKLVYTLHLTRRSMLTLIAPMHRRPRPPKPKKKVTNHNTLYCSTQQSTIDHTTTEKSGASK